MCSEVVQRARSLHLIANDLRFVVIFFFLLVASELQVSVHVWLEFTRKLIGANERCPKSAMTYGWKFFGILSSLSLLA